MEDASVAETVAWCLTIRLKTIIFQCSKNVIICLLDATWIWQKTTSYAWFNIISFYFDATIKFGGIDDETIQVLCDFECSKAELSLLHMQYKSIFEFKHVWPS